MGKHKARVFASVLGLTKNDAELLKRKILIAFRKVEPVVEFEDEYGVRFSAILEIENGMKSTSVKKIWILKANEEIPSLVTCYVVR